ncbi:lipid/multidrug ABC transporter MsbA ATPase and inner membrane domains [Moraxella macacae 0408225]|uniref:Lipid/multidrug ABC transporter MsbA ATPase and inner membrane domains n=1 Tax=Moraxella macacae 0408225 TaxID=1230338 RepID=L2F5J2_9GAMM|nr:lipid A export permease/ATP-binding protein MsbA [Moraxella macacae]ELA08155.1 lipid/multidrug ABC transporter MsbA ATPase and inner membrane domains [Moraxella macacae 0408225]
MPNLSQKSAKKSQKWQTYRRLLGYITPYWIAIVLMIMGFLINAGTEMATAKLIGVITDALAENDQAHKNLLPFLVILLFVFRGIGVFLGNYFSAIISRNMVYRLRLEVFHKLLNLPSEFYLNHSPGQVSAKLIFDVEQVTAAGTDTIKVLLREGLIVIGLFGYLLYLNWKLTAIIFLVLPPIAWLIRIASRRFRKLSKDIQDSMGEVSHIANEVIGGYQVVKNYGGQRSEMVRFTQASKNNLLKGLKIVVVNSINTPMIQLFMAMAMALVIWIAFRPNVMQGVSAGGFIAYLVAVGLLNRPVKALTEVNQGLQRGLAAAESIFQLLDANNEKDTGCIEQTLTGDIHFRDVSVVYPDGKKVIDKLNLHIQAGETVALVGRSGAGKTTLANALMRAVDLSAGEIYLDGIPIDELKLTSLRSQIASVSQQVVLFQATIAQNIAYGELENKSREQIVHAAKSAYAHEFIEKLPKGYDTHIGSDGLQLSGGQRQRLSIARALLKNAPILILDEATSALDNESEFFIQKALEAVMHGRTTIVIAHRLTTIQNADKIVVMDNGTIVEVGNHASLMAKNNHYAKLYERQFNA